MLLNDVERASFKADILNRRKQKVKKNINKRKTPDQKKSIKVR